MNKTFSFLFTIPLHMHSLCIYDLQICLTYSNRDLLIKLNLYILPYPLGYILGKRTKNELRTHTLHVIVVDYPDSYNETIWRRLGKICECWKRSLKIYYQYLFYIGCAGNTGDLKEGKDEIKGRRKVEYLGWQLTKIRSKINKW